jgi:hypothetical protein
MKQFKILTVLNLKEELLQLKLPIIIESALKEIMEMGMATTEVVTAMVVVMDITIMVEMETIKMGEEEILVIMDPSIIKDLLL